MRWLITIATLAVAAACGNVGNEARSNDKPALVTLRDIEPSVAARNIAAVGTIHFRDETPLAFTTYGKVAMLLPYEGATVRMGQVIGSLDTTVVAADLAAAKAESRRAKAELDRLTALYRAGWVTRAQIDASRASAVAAESVLGKAGYEKRNARLVAPSDGLILSRLASPGQVVEAGQTVLVLGETPGGLILKVALTDRDLAGIQPGMNVAVSSFSIGSDTLLGRVTEISGRANPRTGTIFVTVALPPDPRLRSGHLATATFTLRSSETLGTFMVPETALFDVRAGGGFVYTAFGQPLRAHLRRVEIVRLSENGIEVKGEFSPDEKIVVQGIANLTAGQLIASTQRAAR